MLRLVDCHTILKVADPEGPELAKVRAETITSLKKKPSLLPCAINDAAVVFAWHFVAVKTCETNHCSLREGAAREMHVESLGYLPI